MIGLGLQKSNHGTEAVRAISLLPALLGYPRGFHYSDSNGRFVDWAYLFEKNTFYSGSQSIMDVGLFSRITLFKFPFIFSYGHNFKENKNCFYFGSNLNF